MRSHGTWGGGPKKLRNALGYSKTGASAPHDKCTARPAPLPHLRVLPSPCLFVVPCMSMHLRNYHMHPTLQPLTRHTLAGVACAVAGGVEYAPHRPHSVQDGSADRVHQPLRTRVTSLVPGDPGPRRARATATYFGGESDRRAGRGPKKRCHMR
jgi:hypothetical protein